MKNQSINYLNVKMLPDIYTQLPNGEMEYMLFILKAELLKRDTLSVIKQPNEVKINSNRLEGVKRGQRLDLKVKEVTHFDEFWNELLLVNLKNKYDVLPVHSLEEISVLKSCFPNNIRQFNVYHSNKLVAGTTIFESETVAHCQYISANSDKNTLGSLDFLHHYLVTNIFKDKLYYANHL